MRFFTSIRLEDWEDEDLDEEVPAKTIQADEENPRDFAISLDDRDI